jgi:ATP-binding cassette, subfamily B, bacterial
MKSLLFENKIKFALYVFASTFSVVTELGRAFLISAIFNAVATSSLELLFQTGIYALIFIFASSGIYILSRLIRISYMKDVLLSLRLKAFDKIMQMDFKTFNKQSRDTYLSNLNNDINTFESSFFYNLLNFIFKIVLYFAALTILIFLNPLVALVVFFISLSVLGVSLFFSNRTVALQKEVSSANERFTLDVANTFSGLEIVKLNNIEKLFLSKNEQRIAALEKTKFNFSIFTTIQDTTLGTLGYLIFIGMIVYLLFQTTNGLPLAQVILIIQLASVTIFPLMGIFTNFNVLRSSNAIYKKITVLQEDIKKDNNTKVFSFKNKISIKNLFYSYDNKEVFSGISFELKKGKKYLLKGPSGVGKSTLMKLLSNTYDDYKGSIMVDETELRKFNVKSLNAKTAYIYQDVFLFEASLADNLTLFKPYPEVEILAAVKKAGLDSFLKGKKKGLNTLILENGKNLSGGERQRISIARALIKKAELYFIDEATSALNSELALQVEQAILGLDATVVAISHKYFKGVSEKYDYVLEIKDGFIQEFKAKDYFMGVNE